MRGTWPKTVRTDNGVLTGGMDLRLLEVQVHLVAALVRDELELVMLSTENMSNSCKNCLVVAQHQMEMHPSASRPVQVAMIKDLL